MKLGLKIKKVIDIFFVFMYTNVVISIVFDKLSLDNKWSH